MSAVSDLVVHHRYTTGNCADLSGHGNHGHSSMPITEGDGASFDGRSTRIVVFPSQALEDLGGVRIRARILLSEWEDRRTIMEGYLAFSFSVEHDGALSGSIYTGLEWHLLRTGPGAVPCGQWVDVGFVYDGQDTMTLSLNGRTVAARHAILGRMDCVAWPYGLNIGAWPDQAARVFSGQIAEVWLWRLRR
ncbi:LamG-like jellyroll fold domain-containing protein [Streptomyces sp. NPDC059837]|uniref:LamG-like jellyroll fold domain-containing protein n=1 Tax=unclassified Streptomyces TaxID=2593676 RepID=UPI003669FA23